jgi:hypothetical protein
VRWIVERRNGQIYLKVDDIINRWMDGVKSFCTKLPTKEKGNFNNPPDQYVAPLKMGWLTN